MQDMKVQVLSSNPSVMKDVIINPKTVIRNVLLRKTIRSNVELTSIELEENKETTLNGSKFFVYNSTRNTKSLITLLIGAKGVCMYKQYVNASMYCDLVGV